MENTSFEVLAIDFEFNRTVEPHVHLVAVAYRPYRIDFDLRTGESGRLFPLGDPQSVWLTDNPDGQQWAAREIESHIEKGRHILSFGGVAEARSMSALGFGPSEYTLLDMYPMWMQLKHTWLKWQYGKYVNGQGEICESEPPRYDRLTGNKLPGDYTPIGNSLSAAVAAMLGRKIDAKHKTTMRDLIISDPPSFTEEQAEAILRYNEGDITYLPQLLLKMMDEYRAITALDGPTTLAVMLNHSEYVKSQAVAEDTGIPVIVDQVANLSSNYESAKHALISDLCANYYPFYEEEYTPKELRPEWKKKYKAFEDFLISKGLDKMWPRTEPTKTNPQGKFKTDEDTLEAYEGQYQELRQLRQVSKSVSQIGWFRGNSEGNILKYIGSDGRIRTWLAPVGTLTGRNAPKPSKGYIPAMAKWLRALINPPKGYMILEYDWSSQEFLIAAALSGDEAMLEAYMSGDPYTYFAKAAKAMPPEGSKKTHPEVRNLFKSTTLGLQYGMGVAKLALKLSSDMGYEVTEKEAQKLIDLHKRIFKKMWEWRDRVIAAYERRGLIMLSDGWCLFPDNDSNMSTANFPVQGTGACIFREACRLAMREGLQLIYGLHDALRVMCKVEDEEETSKRLLSVMEQAVSKYLEGYSIRNEGKKIYHGIPFLEEGSEAMYESMKPYLLTKFESIADEDEIIKNIFSL